MTVIADAERVNGETPGAQTAARAPVVAQLRRPRPAGVGGPHRAAAAVGSTEPPLYLGRFRKAGSRAAKKPWRPSSPMVLWRLTGPSSPSPTGDLRPALTALPAWRKGCDVVTLRPPLGTACLPSDDGTQHRRRRRAVPEARLYSLADVLARPPPVPALPGVYGWWFRQLPTAMDVSGCAHVDGATLLYSGISPKRPPMNGRSPSQQTLRNRPFGRRWAAS